MGIVARQMGIRQPVRTRSNGPRRVIILSRRRSILRFIHMPIGIVSDDIFDSELGSGVKDETPTHSIPEAKVKQREYNGGRPPETLNVPQSIRKIIGDTAVESGRQDALEVAEFFGVKRDSVAAYSVGATSAATYNKPNEELKTHLNHTKQRIVKRAVNRLNKTFDALTEDKFAEASGPELATMAKSFAAIVKDMSPSEERISGPQVQFVIHTPPIAREEKFATIVVSDARE